MMVFGLIPNDAQTWLWLAGLGLGAVAVLLALRGPIRRALAQADYWLRPTRSWRRILMELSRDAMLLVNRRGRVLEANQTACELGGWTQAELLGRRVDTLVGQDERARATEALRKLPGARQTITQMFMENSRRELLPTEWRWVPASRSAFYIFIRDLRVTGEPRPTTDENDLEALSRVSQAVGQLRDVTSILERALEEAVRTTDSDAGAITFIEQSTGKLTLAVQYGLSEDALRQAIESSPLEDNPLSRQLVARAATISHPALNLAPLAPPVAQVLQQEKIHSLMAVPIIHKAKVIGQMDLYVRRPKRFAAFNPAALSAMAEQIGAAVYSTGVRTELEQKKVELRHVLAASADGFLIVNFRPEDAVVTQASRRFAELFGLAPEQLAHCGLDALQSLLAPCLADAAAFDQQLRPLWNNPNNEQRGELVLQQPKRVTLEYFTTPMRDDFKRVTGRLWVFREATESKP